MAIIISSSTQEKVFEDKDIINIGSNERCDFYIDAGYEVLLTVQIDRITNKCFVTNNFRNEKILFKGKPLQKIEINNICKIVFAGTSEFISVKVSEADKMKSTVSAIEKEELTEEDLKRLYGNDASTITKVKIEKQREPIEQARVAIIKQVAYSINELKNKISANSRNSIFLHIALAVSAIFSSFAVANYLMGLTIQEAEKYLYLPTNIKVWAAYAIIVFGICLMLKQGVYLFLQNNVVKELAKTTRFAQNFMLILSTIFILGIYAVNLVYFMNLNNFISFALFISLFFVGIMATLAISCGYFKCNNSEWSATLNKFEYREDFEAVLKAYRLWIERYINSLSRTKIRNIKDRLFNLQLKSAGEIIVGILTAPFLAYGVSNTLAMCFPEAAGWIRISGLRFSPIFLVLATFLIIFAFFGFVSAFTASKKIQASQVIKQDGFSDYRQHSVNIFGLEGVRKLTLDKNRYLAIACSIIFIEFSMNVSYFMTEIGGDLQGIALSLIAALVPTALLIAETLMLSQTQFDIYACDELLAKIDKD
mgnify:FL=1